MTNMIYIIINQISVRLSTQLLPIIVTFCQSNLCKHISIKCGISCQNIIFSHSLAKISCLPAIFKKQISKISRFSNTTVKNKNGNKF